MVWAKNILGPCLFHATQDLALHLHKIICRKKDKILYAQLHIYKQKKNYQVMFFIHSTPPPWC